MPSLLFILPICTYTCVCMYVQVSAMLRSRQAESGVSGPGPDLQAPASSSLDWLRAAVPPVLHARVWLPRPPPVCVRSVQNISRARPVRLTPDCLSLCWSLSLRARLACLLSLSGGPRRARAEADQAQASTATYLPSSPSQTTAKSFTQHSKF